MSSKSSQRVPLTPQEGWLSDGLQPDPPGQPAQTGDGGGMNSWLHRGVPVWQVKSLENSPKWRHPAL
jgi:hypothetical protein